MSRGRGRAHPKLMRPPGSALLEVNVVPAKNKDATIYITVDNSGSMAGSKIDQVIKSIQQIVDKIPPYFRLVFRSFSDEVKLLVTKKKRYLDMSKVMAGLKKVGGMTSLYDAWGQTLTEIDNQKLRSSNENVYVLIFTDGEDNASRTHCLESVMVLLKEKLQDNVFFSFIQAGQDRKAIDALKGNFEGQNRCQVLSVEDSSGGIKFAFEAVSQNIQLVLRIDVTRSPEDLKQLAHSLEKMTTSFRPQQSTVKKSSGGSYGKQPSMVNGDTQSPRSGITKPKVSCPGPSTSRECPQFLTGYQEIPERKLNGTITYQGYNLEKLNSLKSSEELPYNPHSASSAPAKSSLNLTSSLCSPPHSLPTFTTHCPTLGIDMDGTPKVSSSKSANGSQNGSRRARSTSATKALVQSDSRWKLRVENIPSTTDPEEVVSIFSYHGKCEMISSGWGELCTQWVLLSYEEEDIREYAFKNMEGYQIGNKKVKVIRY